MKPICYILFILVFWSCGNEPVSVFPTYEQQLGKDVASIDAYLLENGIQAQKDPSGLRYIISSKGDSPTPIMVDSIRTRYTVKLFSGDILLQNQTNTLLLGQLIKAWKTALPLVGKAANLVLYVPSGLAYGNFPTGPIPATSNLIFEIEVLNVIKEFNGQLERDKAAIDAFLAAKNITAVKDPAGVRYVITSEGTLNGLTSAATDSVVINYSAKNLSDEVVFDRSAVPSGYRMNKTSTLAAWRTTFIRFKEGTKATLYVPSGLGYGAYGTTSIAPYSNLIYDIELVKVIRK